jgi:exosome complex exonuclease RRP6
MRSYRSLRGMDVFCCTRCLLSPVLTCTTYPSIALAGGGGGAIEDSVSDPGLESHIRALGISTAGPAGPVYMHPYQTELAVFEPVGLSELQIPAVALLDEIPCIWVDTQPKLSSLRAVLEQAEIFAVDLEAHSYRTYSSFCCLMQISTATSDFLVDTLALRGDLHVLNSSSTDPAIVKVLHGADSDVLWLQKDLGLYLVNMFDTGQAARVLELPKLSLSYLLSQYCGVTANKAFQLADWRIRPLTPDMAHYAREDTHYLLHIYARLVNELIARSNAQGNLLKAVWTRSRDICLQRYEKTLYSPKSARALYEKHSRSFSSVQRQVFNALHAWRDSIGRTEDESIMYRPRFFVLLFVFAIFNSVCLTHKGTCYQTTCSSSFRR